jgi:hypothetical protein
MISKEYDKRLEICKKCSNYKKILGIGRCKICGCIMAVKAKIASMKCPMGKWMEG